MRWLDDIVLGKDDIQGGVENLASSNRRKMVREILKKSRRHALMMGGGRA
ncbi:MAG: hypothetical protein ABR548_01180 [Actinomycetota bacterium]